MATPAVGRNTRPVFQMSYEAAADLSAHQFKFVRFVNNRQVNIISDSSAQIPCGILQNNPRQGEAALVMHVGRSLVSADGAVSAGTQMASSDDGQGKRAAATEYVAGQYVYGASAANEIAECLVDCMAPVVL